MRHQLESLLRTLLIDLREMIVFAQQPILVADRLLRVLGEVRVGLDRLFTDSSHADIGVVAQWEELISLDRTSFSLRTLYDDLVALVAHIDTL